MTEEQNKTNILFVDDKKKVLDGLRRMLFSMRSQWNMNFATSGQAALGFLKQNPCDVVISDMRMPGMDGAALLNKVEELYPQTIRFILSGFSDKEMIMRTVGPTHQFISKPCEAEVLKEIILKALDSRNIIDDSELKQIVAKMDCLPTLPDIYSELLALLKSEKSTFQEIATLVSRDVGISAKVLQLVNSAFFGLRQRVDDLQRALTYLGTETLKGIIITADVFGKFTPEQIQRFAIREMYDHSFRVGISASKIVTATTKDRKLADSSTMAGMIHDIGKLLFIMNRPEEYGEVIQSLEGNPKPLYTLEKERFGMSHAELGAYLMGVWGLPETIVQAIGAHHNPLKAFDKAINPVSAIYIANILDHTQAGDISYDEDSKLSKGYLTKLDLLHYLPEWEKIAQTVIDLKSKEETDDGQSQNS